MGREVGRFEAPSPPNLLPVRRPPGSPLAATYRFPAKGSNLGTPGGSMTSYGDAKRVAAAHADLPAFIEGNQTIGLVLLDDDHREQPVLEGQVVRLGRDTLIFRHDGSDEEVALAMISKRVLGTDVKAY